jgi:hypothetical protein
MTQQREMRGKVLTMFHTNRLPKWLQAIDSFTGAEGEDDAAAQAAAAEAAAAEAAAKAAEDDDDGDLPEEFEDLAADHPVRKALIAERALRKTESKARKAAEREARERKEADDARELEKQDTVTREKTLRERAEAKAEKLAAGFLKTALTAAITKAADQLKFIDPDDALQGVDRSKIIVTQDKDDPAEVTIDSKSVEAAVKVLADKKKHLIKSGTDDDQPSGSPFGGGKGGKGKIDDDRMKELYPSLR